MSSMLNFPLGVLPQIVFQMLYSHEKVLNHSVLGRYTLKIINSHLFVNITTPESH